ncbi:hypothetical protein ACFR97_07270 [Haloplanus litoreus]
MTLRCECGAHDIEIVDAIYPEDDEGRAVGSAVERYECQACGRTGTYVFGDGIDRTTGCVTTGRPA